MQGQRCGEIRKHLIFAVGKGTCSDQQGAEEAHDVNLPSRKRAGFTRVYSFRYNIGT
jgi:hypothetical protein